MSNHTSIRVLDEHTINQIAAGEVIENASSIVKELVENSLDAGATKILIEIVAGGRSLIKITDNGKGMTQDDALLAPCRHATSKIRGIDDLNSVLSMGFRGEALSSIASVSKLSILTRHKNSLSDSDAFFVSVEGGNFVASGPAARDIGTTIEVKSLFFNTPARRKFQKSVAKDNAEILKILTGLILAHVDVAFQLISNGEIVLKTKSTQSDAFIDTLGLRISDLLGDDHFKDLISLSGEKDQFSLKGYLSHPTATRPNRSGQYLFINKRAVFSPFISFNVQQAYDTLLAPRRFPSFVLHLDIPTELVDVNVHPQKREVRLRQESVIGAFITQTIAHALQRREEIPLPWETSFETPSFQFQETKSNLAPSFISSPLNVFPKSVENISLLPKSSPQILTLWSDYILLNEPSLGDGIVVVDARRAQFRLFYETLMKAKKAEKTIEIQPLLIPIQLSFSPSESAHLNAYTEELNQMGISIRLFGNNCFIIDALPALMPASDIEQLLHEVILDIKAPQLSNNQLQLTLASSALRRLSKISYFEAEQIIKALFELANFELCPKGKPIYFLLSKSELEKRFER